MPSDFLFFTPIKVLRGVFFPLSFAWLSGCSPQSRGDYDFPLASPSLVVFDFYFCILICYWTNLTAVSFSSFEDFTFPPPFFPSDFFQPGLPPLVRNWIQIMISVFLAFLFGEPFLFLASVRFVLFLFSFDSISLFPLLCREHAVFSPLPLSPPSLLTDRDSPPKPGEPKRRPTRSNSSSYILSLVPTPKSRQF